MMKFSTFCICVLGLACWLFPIDKVQDISVEELLNNLITGQYSGKPMDLDLEEARIETLIARLEKFSGLSFELSSSTLPQSTEKKDYIFKQVPWDQILWIILDEFKLQANQVNGSVYLHPKEENLVKIIREDQLRTTGSSQIPPLLYFLIVLVLILGAIGFFIYKRRIKAPESSTQGFVINPERADEIMKKVTYCLMWKRSSGKRIYQSSP